MKLKNSVNKCRDKVNKKKKITSEDIFGKFPRFSKKGAQEIKDEMRKGWD